MEAEVEQVFQKVKGYALKAEKLEQENLRLKNYVRELQASLLISQSELRLARMMESEEQARLQAVNPVLNSLVLHNILDSMDMKLLKTCRLICKTWNDVVVRILSKRNSGFGPGIVLSHSSESCQILESDRVLESLINEEDIPCPALTSAPRSSSSEVAGSKRVEDLHSVWASAAHGLFEKAYLNDACLNNTEFQRAFLDHGHKLRSIKVTSYYLRAHTLRNILLYWCPNLEELDFNYLQLDKQIPSMNSLPELVHGTLNLTSFSAYMNWKFDLHDEKKAVDIFGDIIIASPKLKKLICKGPWSGGTKNLLNKVRDFPRITRNLETLFLCGNRTLKALNSLHLSNKLKSLTISQPFPREDLIQLLSKVSGSLEKLILTSFDDYFGTRAIPPMLELPKMDNLTEFRYLSDVHTSYKIKSIDFFNETPNLKIVFLSGWNVNNLFQNCQILLKNPHKHLKELYLYGSITSTEIFQVMNNALPNLSKLLVCLTTSITSTKVEEHWNYFDEAFEGISRMHNLRDLYLDIKCLQILVLGTENLSAWARVFSHLKQMPNLTDLSLHNSDYRDMVPWLGEVYIGIPKLRRLTLIAPQIENPVEKVHVQPMYEHGIQLEFSTIGVRKRFQHDDEINSYIPDAAYL